VQLGADDHEDAAGVAVFVFDFADYLENRSAR
jgi:hypothetical protein